MTKLISTMSISGILVLFLAACGDTTPSGEAASTPQEPITTTSREVDLDSLANPVWMLTMGGRRASDLQNDTEAYVAKCMKSEGWTWTPRTYPPSEPMIARELVDYRLAHGYPDGAKAPVTAEDDPNLLELRSLSEPERSRYLAALEGPAGCRTKADSAVYGSLPTGRDPQAVDRAIRTIQSNPAVIGINEAYAQCMAAAGFSSVKTLDDAAVLVGETSGPTTEAKADIECQQAVVWPVWQSVGTPIVRQVMASLPAPRAETSPSDGDLPD